MKRGDVVRVKMPGTNDQPLGLVLRRSQRTGVLTVRLFESSGAYAKGAEIHVQHYECDPSTDSAPHDL